MLCTLRQFLSGVLIQRSQGAFERALFEVVRRVMQKRYPTPSDDPHALAQVRVDEAQRLVDEARAGAERARAACEAKRGCAELGRAHAACKARLKHCTAQLDAERKAQAPAAWVRRCHEASDLMKPHMKDDGCAWDAFSQLRVVQADMRCFEEELGLEPREAKRVLKNLLQSLQLRNQRANRTAAS
jgi:hypothetical protein